MDGYGVTRRPAGRGALAFALSFVVAAALAALAYAVADRPFSTWSHNVLQHPAWAVTLTYIAHALVALAVVGFVLGLASTPFLRRGPLWSAIMAAASATLLSYLAARLLKYGFGRTWPETWVHHNPSWINNGVFGFSPFHGGAGWASFPSGHMMETCPSAFVLWMRAPAWRPIAVLVPMAVMTGLLVADFHWISDCIAGAWFGAAFGAAMLTVFRPRG